MGRGPSFFRWYCLVFGLCLTQLTFGLPQALASGTNVFLATESLQGATLTAAGVKVKALHPARRLIDPLLGTNGAPAVLAILVSETDCQPHGLRPNIEIVAYDPGTKTVIAPLVQFRDLKPVFNSHNQLTLQATGEGRSGIVAANLEALINFTYTDCTATAPAMPKSVTIQPVGLIKPTGIVAGVEPMVPDEALLQILTSDPFLPEADVVLSGSTTTPTLQAQLNLSTTNLNFGTVPLGSNETLTVRLRNNGGISCTVTGLTVNGSTAFTVVAPTGTFTVGPGATVVAMLRFAPLTSHVDGAVLQVISSDLKRPVQYVRLVGNGGTLPAQAGLSVAPVTLDFGAVPLGTNLTKTLTITNSGSLTGTVTRLNFVTNGVGYTVAPAVPFSVAPGTSQVVQVTFTPSSTDTVTGTLEIESLNPTNLLLVALSAHGINPSATLTITPTTLNFGAVAVGTNRTFTVTIANNSLTNCNVTALDTNSGPFTVLNPPAVPFPLAPGAATNILVNFAPTTNGTATGTINVVNDNPTATTPISLTGFGVFPTAAAQIVPDVTALNFGYAALGQTNVLEVMLSNAGLTNATIFSVTLAGSSGLTLITPPAPFDLAPNQFVLIGVQFVPVTVGPVTGQIQIVSTDASNTVQTIPVTGFGVQSQLNVSTNALDFGSIPVPSNRTLSIFLSNTNVVNTTVNSLTFISGSEFTLDPTVPVSQFVIGTNQAVEIPIVFTAAQLGTDIGRLQIVSDTTHTNYVDLIGTGLQSSLAIGPAVLDFGAIAIGTTNTLSVTFANFGNSNCLINSMTVLGNGNFQVLAPAFPLTIAGGTLTNVDISYVPVNVQPILIISGSIRSTGKAIPLP